jgi:hypothetical protein
MESADRWVVSWWIGVKMESREQGRRVMGGQLA